MADEVAKLVTATREANGHGAPGPGATRKARDEARSMLWLAEGWLERGAWSTTCVSALAGRVMGNPNATPRGMRPATALGIEFLDAEGEGERRATR